MLNLKMALPKVLIYTVILQAIVIFEKLLDPFNLPKLLVLLFGSGLMAYILASKYFDLITSKFKSMLIILSIFIAWQCVVLLSTNDNIIRGLLGIFGRNNGLLSYLGLSILMITGAVLSYSNYTMRIIKAITILGLVESLYGIMQIQKADFFNWVYAGNPVFMTFGNEDFGSAFLVLTSLTTTYYFNFIKSDVSRIANAFNLFLQLFVLLHINTAQSKISLIAAIGVFVIFNFKAISKKGKIQKISVTAFSISMGIASILGYVGVGPFSFIHSNLGSLESRILHWQAGWNMFSDHPFFGVGLDSYLDYQAQYRVLDSNGNPDTLSDNAHSIFVQMLATGGLPLLICYLALIVYLLYCLVRAIKSNVIDQYSKIFYSAVLLAFLINSSISIENLGYSQFYWVLSGMMCGHVVKGREVGIKLKVANNFSISASNRARIATVVSLFVYVPSIFLVSSSFVSQINVKENFKALNDNPTNRDSAINIYDIASKYDDAYIRNTAIKLLYNKKYTELGFRLAKNSHEAFPRSVYTLEAIAQYYAKKSMFIEEAKVRELQIELDPKFVAFQERLNQLNSIILNK